jgi:hypothetical protein
LPVRRISETLRGSGTIVSRKKVYRLMSDQSREEIEHKKAPGQETSARSTKRTERAMGRGHHLPLVWTRRMMLFV